MLVSKAIQWPLQLSLNCLATKKKDQYLKSTENDRTDCSFDMNLGLHHLTKGDLENAKTLLANAIGCEHIHPYFKAISSYFLASIFSKEKQWKEAKAHIMNAQDFLSYAPYQKKGKNGSKAFRCIPRSSKCYLQEKWARFWENKIPSRIRLKIPGHLSLLGIDEIIRFPVTRPLPRHQVNPLVKN